MIVWDYIIINIIKVLILYVIIYIVLYLLLNSQLIMLKEASVSVKTQQLSKKE